MGLDEADRAFLQLAIDISRRALLEDGKTPFGAVVAVGGEVAGEGTSQVMELCDPTAHAEVMALRAASTALGRHLIADGTMYSSSEPCPMCLAACYWARIPRVIYAATSHDVATYGFEDLRFYRELARPHGERLIIEQVSDQDQRDQAVKGLREWTEKLPFPVEPKLLSICSWRRLRLTSPPTRESHDCPEEVATDCPVNSATLRASSLGHGSRWSSGLFERVDRSSYDSFVNK